MGYYDEYIRKKAEQAFDFEKTTFGLYDKDNNEMAECLDADLNERMFIGATREMVAYLFERKRNKGGANLDVFFDPENIENVYITARAMAAPNVVVEYEFTPEWFSMEDADLREFYWHPKPALSGDWSAAYFQPR